MKPLLPVLLILTLAGCGEAGAALQGGNACEVESHLSLTSESLADPVLKEIDSAHHTLDIAIYSLTHEGITAAIMRAHERGVRVRVVIDKAQAGGRYAKDELLSRAGIPVCRDTMAGLQHNKFAVVDGVCVVTGSFNWTQNAEENNAENLVVIRSREVAGSFQGEFEALWVKNLGGLICVRNP